mmetsp:Transcript_1501/g.3209  ORF Transcript_1501/g.3209 Transcript_1501/m.3209 type:complete len:250 (+) Transcript_1501:377-1126(+)
MAMSVGLFIPFIADRVGLIVVPLAGGLIAPGLAATITGCRISSDAGAGLAPPAFCIAQNSAKDISGAGALSEVGVGVLDSVTVAGTERETGAGARADENRLKLDAGVEGVEGVEGVVLWGAWESNCMFWLCGEGLIAPSLAVGVGAPLSLEGDSIRESMLSSARGVILPAFTRKSLLLPRLAAFPWFHVRMLLKAGMLLPAKPSSTFSVSGWKTLLYLNLSLMILTVSSTADMFSGAVTRPDLATLATR